MRTLVILTCALSWSAIAADHDAQALNLAGGVRSDVVVVTADPWPDVDPWARHNVDDFLVIDFEPVVYEGDADPVDVPAPEHRGSDEAPEIVLGWSAVALRKLGE